jgi:hypothetical protein
MRTAKSALKVAAEARLWAISRVIQAARPTSGATFRAPFPKHLTPGLKPWAFLYSRSAAKSEGPDETMSFLPIPGTSAS